MCFGLHTAPWYSSYCAASSQTNSALWASALSVSTLHNQDGLSINRNSSNKYQPIDKHCVSPRTPSVSLRVQTLCPCTYKHCLTVHSHLVSAIICFSHKSLHSHTPEVTGKTKKKLVVDHTGFLQIMVIGINVYVVSAVIKR